MGLWPFFILWNYEDYHVDELMDFGPSLRKMDIQFYHLLQKNEKDEGYIIFITSPLIFPLSRFLLYKHQIQSNIFRCIQGRMKDGNKYRIEYTLLYFSSQSSWILYRLASSREEKRNDRQEGKGH